MVSTKPASVRVRLAAAIASNIGFGSMLFLVGLFGSLAFNAKYNDDNKFVNRQIGRQRDIYRLVAAIIPCSILSIVVTVIALLLTFRRPHQKVPYLVLWLIAFLLWIAVMICECIGISWTRYGNTKLYKTWALYEDDEDFRKYVDKWEQQYPIVYNATVQGMILKLAPKLLYQACGGDPEWIGNLDEEMQTYFAAACTAAGMNSVEQLQAFMSLSDANKAAVLEGMGDVVTQFVGLYCRIYGVDATILMSPSAISIHRAVPASINEILHLLYGLGEAAVNVTVPTDDDLDFSEYMQFYYKLDDDGNYVAQQAAPLAMDWVGMIMDKVLVSSDPCLYQNLDEQYEWDHIGSWSAEDFKTVWCYFYRKQYKWDHDWAQEEDRTATDMQKRVAKRQRERDASDRWSSFYICNCTFLAVQVFGVFFTVMGLILHIKFLNRFDLDPKKTEPEEEKKIGRIDTSDSSDQNE